MKQNSKKISCDGKSLIFEYFFPALSIIVAYIYTIIVTLRFLVVFYIN